MPKALWILIIGMVMNTLAGSFLWPMNTIYLSEHLGKSLTLAGFVLMLNSAASIVGNLLGGYLFDKIGGYRSILIGAGIALAALIGITFWHGWPHYAVFLIIIGLGSAIVNPAMYAMAGAAWKEGGSRTFNAMYVGANIGVAIGTALAGYVASISMEYIFPANMILYVFFFLIALFGYKGLSDHAVGSVVRANQPIVKSKSKLSKGLIALSILSIGYAICHLAYSQWQTTIATYTQEINISLEQYSVLWTVNGALIVLVQPFLAIFTKKIAKTLKTQIIIGLVIFMVSFLIASQSTAYSGFIAAMVILTFGEMLIWPAIPAIADQMAEEGKAGFYQGFVNSAATVGRMIGPLLGGFIVDQFGMSYLFIILIGLFGVAIFTTVIYDRVPGEKSKPVDASSSV